ncbi:MAG: hypothetical protein OJF49_001924 [Ktedonobacterales bacterium]|jgi:predicted ATPase/DNA-binding XRE family transcriptional regulator|nr:MAG: hypothetical protein OJF49_001924 [Ktedonobacterales bacterium]
MQPHELRHMAFGALVKYLRKASGLTQLDLATKIPCSVGYLSEIENGEVPKRAMAEALVAALDPLEHERALVWEAYGRAVTIRAAGEAAAPAPLATLGPLVARERELERLRTAIQMALGATPHLVILSGEPGIGKTRLALEALEQARTAGMLTAQGQCYLQQQVVAFAPFVELFEQIHRAAPDELRQGVASRWPMMRPLLPEGMRALVSPVATATQVSAPNDLQRLFWQVTDFLRAVSAHQPVALLLDDIQWMDQASLDLMQYIMRHLEQARILLLATYRDTEVSRQVLMHGVLHPLEKRQAAERLTLSPLTMAQTVELLNVSLPAGVIAPEVSDLIYESSGGIPYTSIELLRGMRERGELIADGVLWRRVGAGKLELPVSILDEIREHIQRLRLLTREVAQAASVLGMTFSAETVAQMTGHSRDAVEDALAETIAAGLVRDSGREGYRFRHALVRDAIQFAGRAVRRRLHRKAAEALLAAPPRRGRSAELAQHFREGDDIAQALIYTLRAGDEDELAYAHKDAKYHYHLAIGLARDLGDAESEAMALERLADVDYLLGLFDEAYEHLLRARDIYRIRQNWERLAWATCQMAKVCDVLGKIPESMRFTEALLDTLIAVASSENPGEQQPCPDTLEARAEAAAAVLTEHTATRVFLCLVARLVHLGRFDEVFPLSVATIAHARQVHDLRMQSLAYSFRGIALVNQRRTDEALAAFQDALRAAEACGDREATFLALANSGALHEQHGDLHAARQGLLGALDALRHLGDTLRTSMALHQLGMNAVMLGFWEEARMRFEEAITIWTQSDRTEPHLAQMGLIYLDLIEGKRSLTETLTVNERAQALPREDIAFGLYASSTFAELEIVAGFGSAVRDRTQRLLDGFTNDDSQACEALALLAWAEWELGHREQARTVLAKARQLADTLRSRLAYVTLWRVAAIIALGERRFDDGVRELESLLALTREMSYPYAEAKALYVYGVLDAARGDPEQARERFAHALTILRQLGERLYAERIEHELAHHTRQDNSPTQSAPIARPARRSGRAGQSSTP